MPANHGCRAVNFCFLIRMIFEVFFDVVSRKAVGIESSSWRHWFFPDERFVLVQQIESRTIDAQIPPQFHITWIGSPRKRLAQLQPLRVALTPVDLLQVLAGMHQLLNHPDFFGSESLGIK